MPNKERKAAKHTPGPWRVGKPTEFGTFHPSSIKTNDDETIAMVYGIPSNCTPEELQKDDCNARYTVPFANAHLIAAAPELLEACKKSIKRGHHDTCQWELIETHEYPCNCGFDLLIAAIAKAEGEKA